MAMLSLCRGQLAQPCEPTENTRYISRGILPFYVAEFYCRQLHKIGLKDWKPLKVWELNGFHILLYPPDIIDFQAMMSDFTLMASSQEGVKAQSNVADVVSVFLL